MDERIKKLLNVCGMPNEDLMEIYSDTNKTFYMEQFAELIIQECASICRDRKLTPSAFTADELLEHFGVE